MQLALGLCPMSSIARQPSRQPDPRQALRKRVWLLLYAEGGWWTAEEIQRHLHMDSPIWNALAEMVRDGFLVRKRETTVDQELSVRYGVGAKCKFPRGLIVDEVQQLLMLAVGKRA
ncbi:MAG TPA: hypothetical protein VF522_19035 [Ramlibacter sp.]|uniref:hypothetical protein n=1 Tax=Ramlibacter sp. TaxID=1917967 RepID=UPI002ED38C82